MEGLLHRFFPAKTAPPPEKDALKATEEADDVEYYQTTVEERGLLWTLVDQMGIMLKRNAILQFRYRKATLAQAVVAPFIFMIVLLILQQADYSNQRKSNPDPESVLLSGFEPCHGFGDDDPCINFMFFPDTPTTRAVLSTVAEKNAARFGGPRMEFEPLLSDVSQLPTRKLGLVPVPSADFIYDYTLRNPNVTEWGITFTETTTPTFNLHYQLWYNSSQTLEIIRGGARGAGRDTFGPRIIAAMRAIDEAIISALNDPSGQSKFDYTLRIKDWPRIPASTLSDNVVQNLGPTFFFCSVMVIFINVLNQIVTEKEQKLRHGMEVMGLKPLVYWTSHYLSTTYLVFINALITSVLGVICGFTAFKETNFGVLLITFFLFGEAMVMLAFFLTCFVRRSRAAVLLGIFLFIIGLLFESFVFSSDFVGYIWWDPGTGQAGWLTLMFIPFFNFGKMFLDITTYTTGKLDDLTETYIKGPGFPWANLYQPLPENLRPLYGKTLPDVPAPVQSWYFLLMNIAFYALLTWYFDNVIPNEYGARRPPWFLFTKAYWDMSKHDGTGFEKAWLHRIKAEPSVAADEDEDEDVKKERTVALDEEHSVPVRIVNLRKFYRNSFLGLGFNPTDKVAVKNLSLTFQEGKLLALLGQNGAGKSTTMNILSGMTPSSSGDALIYGYPVRSQMTNIRKFMGICPQHDILFNDLTAREHIELYAGLKGVPREQWPRLIETRLRSVRLWKVADARAGTYSGGMKRRLSVVISTIGDPKVVFMDEPTTGMDPVNRRHVWSFIEKFKKNRVVVLTTHSMEEADVLGDRIAIMAHGRLRALGNSISLKNKFGGGYRVSVYTSPSTIDVAKAAVMKIVSDAKLEDDSAGALIYQIPLSSTKAIPELVKYFDENPEGIVNNWGISQTTLEEVFLKLIREANPGGYSGYEQTKPKAE